MSQVATLNTSNSTEALVSSPRRAASRSVAASAVVALTLMFSVWFGLPESSFEARGSLIVLIAVIAGWLLRRFDDTLVAFLGVFSLVALKVLSPEQLFATLGQPIVWLLVASFVLAAAVRTSGLSLRLAAWLLPRAKSVDGLSWRLAAFLLVLAFLIPATSARAAAALPLYLALNQGLDRPRVSRALALLIPTVIEVSAIASLLGAGANLIAVETVTGLGGTPLGFGQWLLLGLPLALVSSAGATWLILRLFLSAEERRLPIELDATMFQAAGEPSFSAGWSGAERKVLVILGLVVAGWAAGPWLGWPPALVALVGALLVTSPGPKVLSLKEGLKSVSWELVLFLAASMALSQALLFSGAAELLIGLTLGVFEQAHLPTTGRVWLLVVAAALLGSFAHLAITSRSARLAVLLPPLLVSAAAAGIEMNAMALLVTAAAGFCFTLPASAKPVALYAGLEQGTFSPDDLLRLSRWLMPFHLLLLLVFSLGIWPRLGLPLF